MSNNRFLRKFTLALAAGVELVIERGGYTVHCLAASNVFRVTLDDGAAVDLEAGIGFKVEGEYQRLRLYSLTSQTVEVLIGFGDVFDARTVLTSGAVVGVGGSASITAAAVTVGTSATLVSAAASSRRSLLVQPNGADIYVGGAGVTTSTGVKVPDGQSIELTTAAAVYAVAGSAGIDVRYLSESN